MLYMVAITRKGVKPPASWPDLASAGKVAVPDPNVAASALGALGYFGTEFYADLKAKGAVQVGTPDDVTTGVAQGTYDAGMTIATSAYAAQKKGSPITVSWPKPGAVAIYGPVAISKTSKNAEAAQDFISYVTSREGQTVIGSAGSYPTLPGVAGPDEAERRPDRLSRLERADEPEGYAARGLRQDLRELGVRSGRALSVAALAVALAASAVLVVITAGSADQNQLGRGPWPAGRTSSPTQDSASAVAHSLALSTAATLLAVPIGVAIALALRDRHLPGRRFWQAAVLLPVVVPDFVLAYSWLRAYGRAGLTSELFGFAWIAPAGLGRCVRDRGRRTPCLWFT